MAARATIGPNEADSQPGFREQVLAAPGLLVHLATGGAQFFSAGSDHYHIVETGGTKVSDRQIRNGIGAFAALLNTALFDAKQSQQLAASLFEPA